MDPLMQALMMQMTKRDDGMGGLKQELAGYDALGPGGYKQLTEMGTLDERNGLLEQQMAMADALRQQQPLNRKTATGQIGAGLGNILGALGGGIRAHQLQGEQEGLLDKKDSGRLMAGNARFSGTRNFLADALRGQGQSIGGRDTSWDPTGPATPPAWDGMVSPQGLPPPLTDSMAMGPPMPKKKSPLLADLPSWFPK